MRILYDIQPLLYSHQSTVTVKCAMVSRFYNDFELKENPGNYNNTMRIYNYSEIDGRDAETVSADTKERIARIRKLLLGKVMKEMMGYLSKGYVDMADLKELSDI